jgi:hypothetical protein
MICPDQVMRNADGVLTKVLRLSAEYNIYKFVKKLQDNGGLNIVFCLDKASDNISARFCIY